MLATFALGTAYWISRSAAIPAPNISTTTTQAAQAQYLGKKILYIDSYHVEYGWSAGIARGLHEILDPSGATLKIVYMDTKRNTDEAFKLKAGELARQEIESFQPDVLITCDDNAFKYVVQTYYKDAALPVIFCGLNWDASIYGAPYANTTGMIEVSLTNQIVDRLKPLAKGTRLGYLSADNETERKNLAYYEKLLGLAFEKSYFAKDFSQWKEQFKKLQEEVDIVIFENNAGIANWNDDEASRFVLDTTKVPVGTTNDWMMKYALLGITKIPEEQGEWAAEAALQILGGTKSADIPLVKNKRGKLIINLQIADTLDATFPPSVLKSAEVLR